MWRPWIKVDRHTEIPRHHCLVLGSHPGLLDSMAFAITYWPYKILATIMWWHLDELPWNVPERKNYMSYPLVRSIMRHLKCRPVERGKASEAFGSMSELATIVSSGGNLCLFPTLGRMRWPVEVDWSVGRFIYKLAKKCPELTVVTGRISGEPLWCGPRMEGPGWKRLWQFGRCFFQQVMFHSLTIEYESLDISDLLVKRQNVEVFQMIAKRVAIAITPRNPKFIYPPKINIPA